MARSDKERKKERKKEKRKEKEKKKVACAASVSEGLVLESRPQDLLSNSGARGSSQ